MVLQMVSCVVITKGTIGVGLQICIKITVL